MLGNVVGWVVLGTILAAPAAALAQEAPLSAGAYIRDVGTLKAGDRVPKFKARDIYGVEVGLEDLMRDGRKPVLAFWSMYCQACVEKFNSMVAVQAKFEPRGLKVISINTDGEYQKGEQTIRDFIADYERKNKIKINFPVLYDERNWVPQTMHVEFLPTIVSVGPDGGVFGFYQGFDEAGEAEIRAGIETLVEQMLAQYPGGAAAPGSVEKK